jgi:two-component system response regulator WspF
VFKAIGLGALDAVDAPFSDNDEQAELRREIFLKKVRAISRLRQHENTPLETDNSILRKTSSTTRSATSNRLKLKTIQTAQTEDALRRKTETFRRKTETFRAHGITLPPLVVIGASTGGPKTLVKVFAHLPESLNAAIIVVQHLDQEFSAGLADWLNTHTALHVQVAMHGMHPQKGVVDVAGTNDHLVLTSALTYVYTSDPSENPYRPSVDVFFRSIARYWPYTGCAILLTGMGRDGAAELLTLRSLGWHTIAQNQATSIVYGMPKAAKEINAAKEILPLESIGMAIQRFAEQRSCAATQQR